MDDRETWNPEDLKNASSSWSLQEDKKLIQLLETMQKNIVCHSQTTTDKLKCLTNELEKSSLSLSLVNNRFMGLSNTQFIENLVQEDDTEIIKRETNEHETNAENREDLFSMVTKSVELLESICDHIEISPDSDSGSDDEETNDLNSILQLKDPYENYQLPPIIGTEKWFAECRYDKVEIEEDDGAQDNDEDLTFIPSVPAKDKSSMSLPFPIQKYTPVSSLSTSSENEPIINNHKNEEKQANNKAPQMLTNPSDFAAELAKKLGGNIPTANISSKPPKDEVPKPKTLPLFKPSASEISAQVKKVTGNLFSDEPPPLDAFENPTDEDLEADETDDFLSSDIFRSAGDGLFGNRPNFGGLFDKPPDQQEQRPNHKPLKTKANNLSSQKDKETKKSLFDDSDSDELEKPSLFTRSHKPQVKKLTGGFFDDDDEDFLEEIKNTSIPSNSVDSNAKSSKASSNLFKYDSDSDDDLFKSLRIAQKNTNDKTADPVKPQTKEKNADENALSEKIQYNSKCNEINVTKLSQENILKDMEDTKQSLKFPGEKPPIINTENVTSPEIKDKKNAEILIKPPIKPKSIFENDDDDDDEPELFTKKTESIPSTKTKISHSIFDDSPPPLDVKPGTDKKNTNSILNNEDDDDDDDSDLFSSIRNITKPDPTKSNIGIFHDKPPELDDDLPNDYTYVKTLHITPKVRPSNMENKQDEPPLNIIMNKNEDEKNTSSTNTKPKIITTKPVLDSEKQSLQKVKPDEIKPAIKSRDTDKGSSILSIKSNLFKQSLDPAPSQKSPTKTVGKLHTDLNINVKALIPGSTIKIPKAESHNREKDVEIKKSVSFDDDSGSKGKEKEDTADSILCNSIAKDRVKIQVKRRPSTRKARHEAIRKSAADMTFNFDEAVDSDFVNSLPNSPNNENESKVSDIKNTTETLTNNIKVIPEKPSFTENITNAIRVESTNESSFSDDDTNFTDIFKNNPGTSTLFKKPQIKIVEKNNIIIQISKNVDVPKPVKPINKEKKSDLFDIFNNENESKVTDIKKTMEIPTNIKRIPENSSVSKNIANANRVESTKEPEIESTNKTIRKQSSLSDDDSNFTDIFKNEPGISTLFETSRSKIVEKNTDETQSKDLESKIKKEDVPKPEESTNKEKKSDLFDIFHQKMETATKTSNIFFDDDSPTDIFKGTKTKTDKKLNLFDNSDDDDLGLFSSSAKNKKSTDNLDIFTKDNKLPAKKSLFNDADKNLFEKPKEREAKKASKKTSLFGSDNEEELFFKPSKEGPLWSSRSTKSTTKSLFGDDNDDDDDFDLFKTKKVSQQNKAASSSKQAVPAACSAEVTNQDPLSSFQDY